MSANDGSEYDEEDIEEDEVVLDNELEGDGIDPRDEEAFQEESTLKIQQKVGDRTCATYTFEGEDHTLGNLLRFALIKNPSVDFCAYSITHPSEHNINMRLQTIEKGTNEVMIEGLEAVEFMTDVAERKFREELSKRMNTEKPKRAKSKKRTEA